MTDEYQIDNVTWAEKDGNGNIVVDPDVVNTDKASVTGDTEIESSLQSSKTGISSDTWVVIADTENEDNNNEQDASFNINPNESGKYVVSAFAFFQNGADQDRIDVAIRNVDSGNSVANGVVRDQLSGTQGSVMLPAVKVTLQSGTNYQIQARNLDSSSDLLGGTALSISNCFYQVEKAVVQ